MTSGLLLAGYRVMRCTWSQIVNQPGEVAKTVSCCWASENGEGGIRTLEAGITRPRDFQSRSLSQLGHLSGTRSEGGLDTAGRG